MKRILVLVAIFVSVCISLFAVDLAEAAENDEFLKEILVSDIPVTYGDEAFRERILARTEGKRDPIGLILTGGSARACAHIGVLRYLDEVGIVPDFIVSNSMGSIIGMLYAAGISSDQIEEILKVGDISSYFSLTIPTKGGLIDGSGFRALINYIVGEDYRVEDTDIPIMVVCDDLVSKREIRITEGPFTDILMASFALPAYFQPYEYNGHLLVDGGVVSLAPIEAAYEYSDTIILSTTFYDADSTNLINPITIINSSFDIGKRQNAAGELKRHPDIIWIRCAVEQFSFMAFKDAALMADIGYESTKEVAEKLSTLYKGERTISQERREEIDSRISETRKNLSLFGRLKSSEISTMLGITFTGLDQYHLKNSMITGLKGRALVGNMEFGGVFGFSFDTQNLSSTSRSTTLGGEALFYPFANTRIKLEAYTDFFRDGASFVPQVFIREALDVFLLSNDKLSLSLHESIEYYNDYAERLGKGLTASASLLGVGHFGSTDLTGSFGYLLAADTIDFQNSRNYLEAGIKVDTTKIRSFLLSGGLNFRINIDEKGRVPLFISDGYVGRSTGYGATCLETDYSLFNLVASVDMLYSFSSDPTFGEFLIFESPMAGIFSSALFSKERIGVIVGGEIKTTCSLIGLVKLPLTFRIGYEFAKENKGGLAASITFSSAF